MTTDEGTGAVARAGLPPGLAGRLTAAIWVGSSLLIVASQLLAPGGLSRSVSLAIGAASLCSGLAIWFAPWERLGMRSMLWLTPAAFVTIGADYRLADANPFVYGIVFFSVFVVLGIAQPRRTSLWFSPVFVLAYLAPLVGRPMSAAGLASAVYVVPCCVATGEAVAWGMSRLARSEASLREAEERSAGVFAEAPMGLATCSWDGHLLEVNRTFGEILGRDPASLVGSSFAALTMGEDRGGERELIEQLRSGTVDRFSVETRLVHAEGRVVWVAVTVSSVHDADGGPGYMIGMIEDITERRALREQMAFAAVHDQLTGLPNRTHFMDRLDRTLRRAQLDRRSVALLFLDLDRFKLVNDGLGHEAGDRLLQRVAQRLQHAVRPTDLLARFGGDEFTVLCEAGTEAEARDVADRLQRAMRRPVGEDDHEQFVTLSIGIALSSPATVSGAELLQRADVAMYRAKEQGPSRVAVYCADDELATVRNLRTSNELHRALDREEFVLHYQPFVDLTDLRTVGCEALVRWRHPTRGLLGPGEFIPQAESSGLIVPLGTWVLREACRQGAEWTARRERDGLDTGRCNVSVNVAPIQLADPDFPAVVEAAVAEAGFCADQLWLEITEGAILRDPAAAVEVLGELRAIGTHLSIDDFGTGYSSLSYLKQLPVEILKIDRSFVAQIEEDLDDMAIVRAVLALGDSLGLAVIAEGIERPGQADQLTALGCHFAQGFLYGRPLPAEVLGSYPADDLGAWSTEGEALGA